MESLLSLLADWNKGANERVKLQHAYIAVIIVGTVVAGLTALINPVLGHTLIVLVGFLAIALIANLVMWALLKTFVIDRVKQKRPR